MSDLRTQLRSYFEATITPGSTGEAPAEPLRNMRGATAATIIELEPPAIGLAPWWRRPVVLAAAAIAGAVALILGGLWLGNGSEVLSPADQPAERAVPELSIPAEPQPEESSALGQAQLTTATAIVERLYDSYDEGDLDAVIAITENAHTTGLGSLEFIAWDMAQGSILEDRMCEASPSASDVQVSCTMTYLSALSRAARVEPLELIATVTVSSQGEISFLNERLVDYGNVAAIQRMFDDWVATNHSEDGGLATVGEWESVDEAANDGELRARYVEEYAAYLAANGCSFDEPCEP